MEISAHSYRVEIIVLSKMYTTMYTTVQKFGFFIVLMHLFYQKKQ